MAHETGSLRGLLRTAQFSRISVSLVFVLAFFSLNSGCQREASEPIPRASLFPNKPAAGAETNRNPFGALARAKNVVEVEPNDGPEQAQSLAVQTVVSGTVGPSGDVPGATDWFVLDPSVAPGRVLRLELQQAPKCARLAIVDGAGNTLQSANVRRGAVVFDHLPGSAARRFVTVRCRGRSKQRQQPAGGAYRLQLSSRPIVAGEEVEPNHSIATASVGLQLGVAVQGTLGYSSDLDVWRLAVAAEGDGPPLVLSVTGLPGVALKLTVYGNKGAILLKRRGARGQPLLIPNFHRSLGGAKAIGISGWRGATSNHVYALALRELAAPALGQINDREPSDRRTEANMIALDSVVRGIVDGPGDVDWFGLDAPIGTSIEVTLRCPSTLKARLVAHVGDSTPTWATAGTDGTTLRLPRLITSAERVWIRVHGVDNDHDPAASYQLEVANMSALDAALDLSGLATSDLAPTPTPTAF